MNRNIIIGFLAALLLASCGYQKKPEAAAPSPQGAGKDNLPLNAQLIGPTPIKNKARANCAGHTACLLPSRASIS